MNSSKLPFCRVFSASPQPISAASRFSSRLAPYCSCSGALLPIRSKASRLLQYVLLDWSDEAVDGDVRGPALHCINRGSGIDRPDTHLGIVGALRR